jgi:hypothetical protein
MDKVPNGNVKLTCPACGNGLFHCGLAGEPYWCGACNWRGPIGQAIAVCPKCERRVAPGVTWIDTAMACPRPKRCRLAVAPRLAERDGK